MKKKIFINYFYKKAAEKGYPLRIEQLEDYTQVIDFMHLTDTDTLLDVGCGAGTFVEFAQKHCWSVGMDSVYCGQTHCILGEGEALPFSDQSFSVVYFSKSLALMEMDNALKEAYRVTVPEGRLVVRELVESNPFDNCMSWIFDQLLKENMYGMMEYPYIPDITLETAENLISPWWNLAESATFTTTITYPSEHELVDRLLFYSPLSVFAFDVSHSQVEFLRGIIDEGVTMFFKEPFSVETTSFILEASKYIP